MHRCLHCSRLLPPGRPVGLHLQHGRQRRCRIHHKYPVDVLVYSALHKAEELLGRLAWFDSYVVDYGYESGTT